MHKTYYFFFQFPFFISLIPWVNIIGVKHAPGDHESNFKEVGAIPSEPKVLNRKIFMNALYILFYGYSIKNVVC